MEIRHKRYPVGGIQFHPESIPTASEKAMLMNFLERHGWGSREFTHDPTLESKCSKVAPTARHAP